jgi:L-rhamnose mutarotase
LQRKAFQLRIRKGSASEYEAAHREVWPELIEELTRFGVSDYSIFRRGQELFLYLRVPDFDALLQKLAASDVNRRWQQRMAHLFEPVPSLKPDEPFAMMEEVFFMPGANEDSSSRPAERTDAR